MPGNGTPRSKYSARRIFSSSSFSVSASKLACRPAATSINSGTVGANSSLPSDLGLRGFSPAACMAGTSVTLPVASSTTLRVPRSSVKPMPPMTSASTPNTGSGMPGISPMPSATAAAIISARGCAITCAPMSLPTLEGPPSSVCTRVTIMPAQMAMNSAGICEIRPSPMVRIE